MNNNEAKKRGRLLWDVLPMTVAQLAIVALTCLGAFLLELAGVATFDMRVVLGSVLGVVVILLNYIFLIVSVDRAIANFLTLVGGREMDEEEAQKFAEENSMPIQNAMKLSFIIRTVSMLAALVVAFILDWFNPIATAIPLLAYRPLLTLIETIKGKVTNEEK